MQVKQMKSVLVIALGIAAAAGGLVLRSAQAQKSIPEPSGKITPWQAIKIATGKVPGRALNANFEFDEGHWVYGVVVVSGKKLQEIEIDPNTGKITDTEAITPEGEGKETTAELNAALGNKGAAKESDEKDEKPEKK